MRVGTSQSITAAQNKGAHSTGNLPHTLSLMIGESCFTTGNVAIEDGTESHLLGVEQNQKRFLKILMVQFTDPEVEKQLC